MNRYDIIAGSLYVVSNPKAETLVEEGEAVEAIKLSPSGRLVMVKKLSGGSPLLGPVHVVLSLSQLSPLPLTHPEFRLWFERGTI